MSTTYSRAGAGQTGGTAPGRGPSGSGRRTPWLIAGAAALLGTLGGTALGVSRAGGGNTASPTPSSSSTASATTPAASVKPASSPPSGTPSTAVQLTNIGQFDPASAAAVLTGAGLRVTGKPQDAWQWTDANGRNVIVLTRQVTHTRADGSVDGATLRVVHAARLDTKPIVLRSLTDPGAVSDRKTNTCEFDFGLDFMSGSISVTDADGDGYAEVTVGWWSQCRSDPGPQAIKLALLENGRYYILRGLGLRAADRTALTPQLAKLIPAATYQPDPSSSHWPKGSYAPTLALFKRLYS